MTDEEPKPVKTHLVGVRLTAAGINRLDELRGTTGRAEYIRGLLRDASKKARNLGRIY